MKGGFGYDEGGFPKKFTRRVFRKNQKKNERSLFPHGVVVPVNISVFFVLPKAFQYCVWHGWAVIYSIPTNPPHHALLLPLHRYTVKLSAVKVTPSLRRLSRCPIQKRPPAPTPAADPK